MLILSLLVALILLCLILIVMQFKALGQKSQFDQPLFKEELRTIIDTTLRNELSRSREEFTTTSAMQREELSNSFKRFSDSLSQRLSESATQQKEQLSLFSNMLNTLTRSNENRFDRMNTQIGEKITTLQNENNKRLDKINETVDEKLHKTLEERLGHSFKLVSENLEKVQQGLGEMQNLATGVGDLKKVLTNVKTKGVLGEYQLGNILEQLLTPTQYGTNVKTKRGSDAHVEFAIKLPGRKENGTVWIPLDSKFPTEPYQELIEVYDLGDKELIDRAQKKLNRTIKSFAKDISSKYIDPPHTTDFGIMFLPIEGLYAEVLRDHELFQTLQQDFKIMVAGPTTLSALLTSLQMGFRTLAIEQRSSEVWQVLGSVKTEFIKFGGILEKTQKKIEEAGKTIESAGIRTRAIERKLRSVEELPASATHQPFDTLLAHQPSLDDSDLTNPRENGV